MRRVQRDEKGNIAMTMTIMLIATGLTAALLTTVFNNLSVSRRSGDSANALQVADAGVNDAIKAVQTAAVSSGDKPCAPPYNTLPGFTRTAVVGSGTYTYCVALDSGPGGVPVWHIDAVGQDKTGAKRHVRADAQATSLYSQAIVVLATLNLSAGWAVDSFTDESNTCTQHGYVGTNDAANFTFGSHGNGNGVSNCRGNSWGYPVDGCVAYSRTGTEWFTSSAIGQGQCPDAPISTKSAPEFIAPTVSAPTTWNKPSASPTIAPNWTCSSASLVPGDVIYAGSVTLTDGCGYASSGTPSLSNPVRIFANTVNINGNVNQPVDNLTNCGVTTHVSSDYCPGWSGNLQVNVLGSGPNALNINSGHATKVWMVVNAPRAVVNWPNNANHWDWYGSLVVNSISGGTQTGFHYDESLAAITSGRYVGANWREEPS